MDQQLCIISCNSLAPEISHIVQNGDFPDVTLKSFPAVCTGCTITDDRILEIIGHNPDQYSKVVVIVSTCRGKKNGSNIHLKNAEIIRLEQCLEILFPLPTIYHYINQGNYLVSNGWLRNYTRHIREWGFEPDSAKSFFGESIRKIILLETGLPGYCSEKLIALSEYMGAPYEILPVGNSHLRSFLDSVILGWRNDLEKKTQNNRIAKLARESADHSLMFAHLKNLINHIDEHVIIHEITNLLNLLFAPEKVNYYPYFNGIEINSLKNTSFNPSDSITIEIKHLRETLGLFEVIRVRFPQFISQYKPMEQVISQIGGLAISNARRYAELMVSESKFRNLVNQMQLGLALHEIILDEKGEPIDYRFLDVNSSYERITGIKRENVLNRTVLEVLPGTEKIWIEKYGKVALSGIPESFESFAKELNMYFSVVAYQPEPNQFAVIVEDITDRKMMELEIRNSETSLRDLNSTKDKFFSIISHDLRNPISSIMNLTGLLADDTYNLSIEDNQKLVQSINKNTQAAYQLLENLLEWSRLQKGVVPFDNQIVNLKMFIGTCDHSVVEMATNKSITLTFDIPESIAVTADQNMLRSILRNLVTNAIKFTPEGGSVEIKAREFDNQSVLISIKDTGLGMKKELIDQLFRIDTQVSRPGTNNEPSTGLGLIITKEFVDRHEGRIWVESEVGKGSTFYFTLPC